MKCQRCGKNHNDVPKVVTIGINKVSVCKECYVYLMSPLQPHNIKLDKSQR